MKKQCINVVAIIGVVFIIGVLLGNIIISHAQDNKISIEPTTQTEPMMYLERPLPIQHFLYNNATLTGEGKFVSIVLNEETTYTKKENHVVVKPSIKVESTTESTTIEETTIEETNTTENESETNEDSTTDSEETTTIEETTAPQYIVKAQHYAVPAEEIYYTSPIREYTEEQKTLIAKMLYCEAGGEGWDCQVTTCSAIINFIEHYGGNFSVLDNGNKFSPASYYRYKTPTKMNWEVLDYVLSGHLIANVKYFQLYDYHSFGTPMLKINGVYFSR